MILPAIRKESVACIRIEAPPGSGKFLGCGKGWVQERWAAQKGHPRCPDCGRPLLVTGSFLEAKLR